MGQEPRGFRQDSEFKTINKAEEKETGLAIMSFMER